MMSRSRILALLSSSRQMMMAWNVSGLSHRPAIMASRPASMRLAMAISPSRESSSTEPMSRRYMRTGSSVRSVGSERALVVAGRLGATMARLPSSASSALSSALVSLSAAPSSASSLSTTVMPMSDSIDIVSSIWSGDTSCEGRTALSWSSVTKPRAFALLMRRLTAASDRSRSGLSFSCVSACCAVCSSARAGVAIRSVSGAQGVRCQREANVYKGVLQNSYRPRRWPHSSVPRETPACGGESRHARSCTVGPTLPKREG